MSGEDKRRSERVIPFVSDEEVVMVSAGPGSPLMAKLLDLSDVGTLVYMLVDDELPAVGESCNLSLFHRGKVFDLAARIARKAGRLTAFDFTNVSPEAAQDIQAKLIRMEVDWLRLSKR